MALLIPEKFLYFAPFCLTNSLIFSGVYHHVKGRRFYHQHTLRLIGWGVENGTPYWLLVNSWGKTWGDQGTVKILRGQAECNLEYYVSTAVPKRDW